MLASGQILSNDLRKLAESRAVAAGQTSADGLIIPPVKSRPAVGVVCRLQHTLQLLHFNILIQ